MTDKRERRLERLMEATNENTKSGALDTAVKFYLNMAAVDAGHQVGAFSDLFLAAEKRGCLTGPEIAEILDCEAVPVEFSVRWELKR